MKENKFKHISDEQLAAFIDGNTTEAENDIVLDAVESREDLETLVLVLSAKRIAEEAEDVDADKEELKDMPDPKLLSSKKIKLRPFEPLPMTGFLGSGTDEETPADEKEE